MSADAAYAEVVTHARSRDVELPGGAGTLVLITLDNDHDHTRPTTLGPAGLDELDDALAAALARTDIAAVAVTGKPYFFCVGADLNGVAALRTAEQARSMAERGHEVFARLRNATVPTFAFVNGAAMGGGPRARAALPASGRSPTPCPRSRFPRRSSASCLDGAAPRSSRGCSVPSAR